MDEVAKVLGFNQENTSIVANLKEASNASF
jgi:hypothetical protein